MKLLLFPHSHFCEKARWALDYKQIAYEPVAVFPGLHRRTIRRIAPGSSLPVLVTGARAIQGSDAIIDYLEECVPTRALTPAEPSARDACLELERRMDAQLGVPVRQILYASLLDHPAFIRRCFTHTMPWWKRAAYPLVARPLRGAIYAGYVISPAAADAARLAFDDTMTTLAARIGADDYLIANTFTRAFVDSGPTAPRHQSPVCVFRSRTAGTATVCDSESAPRIALVARRIRRPSPRPAPRSS